MLSMIHANISHQILKTPDFIKKSINSNCQIHVMVFWVMTPCSDLVLYLTSNCHIIANNIQAADIFPTKSRYHRS